MFRLFRWRFFTERDIAIAMKTFIDKYLNEKNLKKGILLLFLIAVLFWVCYCGGTGAVETSIETTMRGFTLVLWSILLEALPFVLLGTIISSLIQVFVTEDMILRILPKNNLMQLVLASLIGLVFPVCECAIIPITRGLIKKGMPVGPAVAFMIATPIINPIVLLSTYNAFPAMPQMVFYRAAGGFLGAVLIGLLVSRASGRSVLKADAKTACGCGHDHGHGEAVCACSHERDGHETCGCGHEHEHEVSGSPLMGTLKSVLSHTGTELRSVGGYLIFGAMIAALVQIAVPKEVLVGIGSGRTASILVMMALAFVLSLCSEADAFVASTFLMHFSGASVLAFLITGPMIDIKNTMMLMGSFKKRFALRLILTILLVCFLLALAASFMMGGQYA